MRLLALQEKRNDLMERCLKLEQEALKLLQKCKHERQKHELFVIKENLSGCKSALKNVGNTVPSFFAGDLLDMESYIDYFDSIFSGENVRTSTESRKPGNTRLKKLAFRRLSKKMPKEQIEQNFNNGNYEALHECVVEEIDEQSAALSGPYSVIKENLNKEERRLSTCASELKTLEASITTNA